MKTIKFKITLLLLIVPLTIIAGEDKGKYKKEKKISKAYIVNPDAALNVNNKYGNIFVTTWNENKTVIDVAITVSGNKESNVDKRLNSIDVAIEATKNAVQANTKIGSFNGNNTSMEINYTIKIPKNGSIDLNNIYGRIAVGKIYGKATLRCQYGNLDIEELNSTNNTISIQYCDNSKARYIKTGSMKAQYSDVWIERAENFEVKSEYSEIKIGTITELNYNSDYGDVTIGKSARIIGKSTYSDLRVEKVEELLHVAIEYGDIKMALDKSVKNVSINSSYSDVTLVYMHDSKFNFELLTEYSNSSGDKGDFKYTTIHDKDFNSHHIGQYGGNSNNKIYIKSTYGDIKWVKI
ncbi:DUF4097 domain-containing protein [Flavobacterium sp. LaA7.5]|nr:DUF4097 domain-containing protein [Flavobacterium salilacus subsp. altitudinum]